jgi:hypothetical protein
MPSYNYFVTFRIADKTVGGKSYTDRYETLIDNVYVEGNAYWDETTSFLIVGSPLDTNTFLAKACKGLSANDDIVVAFDPTDMSAAYFGPIKHPDVLETFFRTLKKAA